MDTDRTDSQFYRVMMAARSKKSAIRNPLLYPLSYGSKNEFTEQKAWHNSTRCTTLSPFSPCLNDTGFDIVLTHA